MKRIINTGVTIFKSLLPILFAFAVFTLITSRSNIFFGMKSFTVITGSMQPTLPVGSIVYTAKQPVYKTGDIITFKRDAIFVTHRIKSVVTQQNQLKFQTKGDANKAVPLPR